MNTTIHRRRSKVWLSFSLEGDTDDKAVCRVCSAVLSRTFDDNSDKCTTTKLWKHLSQNHPEVSKMLSRISQDDIITEGLLDKWNLDALQKQSNKGFTSKVWKFFEVDREDKNMSICCECSSRISRGADRNTTSMWNHVKLRHPELYQATQTKKDEKLPSEPEELSSQKATVRDEFLLYNVRQNSYICKTCGMIMRLESPIEYINTTRLIKHLDHIFHKRVQHGLEPPKRPIVPKRGRKSLSTDASETEPQLEKTLPAPVASESVIADREVDLVHSGVMMRTMYMQQQRDLCCDCTILIPHKEKLDRPTNQRIAVRNSDDTMKYYETDSGYEFKVHACVLAIASDKIKTLMDSAGASTIMMHDITKDAMLSFIEIAYLGKLKNLFYTEEAKIWEIYLAAQSFNSKLVLKYLERECMQLIEKYSSENPDQYSFGKFSVYFPGNSLTGVVKHNNINNDSTNNKNEEDKSSKPLIHMTNIDNVSENEDASPSGLSLLGISSRTNIDKLNGFENEVASPSGLSLLGISSIIKSTLPNKRKRPPLSSTFKLKVKSPPKKKKDLKKDISVKLEPPDLEDVFGYEDDALVDDYDIGESRFEIKGDTAILRSSPEHFNGNGADPDYDKVKEEQAETDRYTILKT